MSYGRQRIQRGGCAGSPGSQLGIVSPVFRLESWGELAARRGITTKLGIISVAYASLLQVLTRPAGRSHASLQREGNSQTIKDIVPSRSLRDRLSRIKMRLKHMYLHVRMSRFLGNFRSETRHIRHIRRFGRRAWCHLSDLGVNGNPRLLENWLRRRPLLDLNQQDVRGNTVLMNAVRAFNNRMVRWLLEREDVDITLMNRKAKTALIVALDVWNWKAVELLAHRGAVEDAENRMLYPLHMLCMKLQDLPPMQMLYVLAVLLRHGASLNRVKWKSGTPLDEAVRQGHRQWAYLLVMLGARLPLAANRHHCVSLEKLFPVAYSIFVREFSSAKLASVLVYQQFQQPVCCKFCVLEVQCSSSTDRGRVSTPWAVLDDGTLRLSLPEDSATGGCNITAQSDGDVKGTGSRHAGLQHVDATFVNPTCAWLDAEKVAGGPLEFLATLVAVGAIETVSGRKDPFLNRAFERPRFLSDLIHTGVLHSPASPIAFHHQNNESRNTLVRKMGKKNESRTSTRTARHRQSFESHFKPFVTLREVSFWCPK